MLAVSAVLLVGPLLTDGAEVLRDPTRPYAAKRVAEPTTVKAIATAKATGFSVSAILVSQKRRVAIVNGKRVSEGDKVDGATVVKILADRLRLNLHGKEITARLPPDALRK
jgi:hypothetical protein